LLGVLPVVFGPQNCIWVFRVLDCDPFELLEDVILYEEAVESVKVWVRFQVKAGISLLAIRVKHVH
jgi:hypothetical protein